MTSALSRISLQSHARRVFVYGAVFWVFIALVAVCDVRAADVARIGVVDFQRVLRDSLAGKAAANTLRQKQDERSADLKKRRQEIVNLQAALERMELLADPSDREQKKLELTLKLDAFNEADAMYAGQLKEINTKQTAEIRQAVSDVVDAIGKKGGYLLILEKNDTVYAPASTDITVQVIEAYNKQYTGNQ
jgi:outer membrane protein